MKIKALNPETGEFQEKILTLEAGFAGECVIGRDPSCSLVLHNPEISRIHARIFSQEGHYYFADLGSTNGSQIDNQEIEINHPYNIQPDNLISIGGFVITIAEISLNEDNSKSPIENSKESAQSETTLKPVVDSMTTVPSINPTEDLTVSKENSNSPTPTAKSSKKGANLTKKAKNSTSKSPNREPQGLQATIFGKSSQSLAIRTIAALWKEWLIVHSDKF